MDYTEALDYIYGANKFAPGCALKNIRELLKRLGNPQNSFKAIHIAGTNGKGSIASMLTHILIEAGYKVGMFTSPHLESFTERIQVDLKEISRAEVERIVSSIKEHIDDMVAEGHNHPRWFEIVVAIAFEYFAKMGVEYAVVETGLGGGKDATNILNPKLSIIASISHDHTNILGDNLEDIAFEKAGIIKPNVPVVIYPQVDSALNIIKKVAKGNSSPIYEVADANIKQLYLAFDRQIFNFRYKDFVLDNVTIHISGKHQIFNAATAIMAIIALNGAGADIAGSSIMQGLVVAKWAGRLERLATKPDILVDGAHNVASAKVLADALKKYYADSQIVLVIGMSIDKDVDRILQILCPLARYIVITRADNDRAMDIDTLSKKASSYHRDVLVKEGIKDAIKSAVKLASLSDAIVFSGSLYLVAEVRKIINQEF